MPIERNQITQIGPNSLETAAVPRDWIANNPARIARLMSRIRFSVIAGPMPGKVLSPSTADSTDSEGVITASP